MHYVVSSASHPRPAIKSCEPSSRFPGGPESTRQEPTIDIGQAGLMMDGQHHTNSVIELYLNDQSRSAHASRSLPTQGPTAVAFPAQRELTWTEQDGHGKLLFGLSGSITHLTTAPLVLLNVRRLDNDQLRISWPLAVRGGTLEESDGLALEQWHPVGEDILPDGMENAVILPPGTPARFIRLVLP